jgi:hypothetical protein
MQVAMVGSDGIVLASDKQLLRDQGGYWQPSSVRKITVDEDKGLAVAYAKNNLGMVAAERIPSRLAGMGVGAWPALLCNIAEEAFIEDQEMIGAGQALVVSPQCPDRIYFLEIGKASRCLEFEDKIVGRDSGNPSQFFAARYYDKSKSVADLAFLAAYTISCGSRLNPGGIQGLDVLFCRNSGFTWATKGELADYEQRAKELDEQIERAIWPGSVVDKDTFDSVMRSLINSKPITFKEAVAKPKRRKDGGYKQSAKKSRG